MSTSTLILNPEASGSAQTSPNSYPCNMTLTFNPQGDVQVLYGLNGATPTIPLSPGQTNIVITSNSLQLEYKVTSGQAKIQWEL